MSGSVAVDVNDTVVHSAQVHSYFTLSVLGFMLATGGWPASVPLMLMVTVTGFPVAGSVLLNVSVFNRWANCAKLVMPEFVNP